jgi:tetratricopeptide (TPR) repeat protein
LHTEVGTPPPDGSATRTGSVLGTPSYMAPEQAGGEIKKLDPRSDVFGLGAILCQILTGQPPYEGREENERRLQAVRGEMAEALARLDACGAEPELVALCKRCLALRQEDRPEDGRAVAAAVVGIRQAAEARARQAELDRERALVRAAEQAKRRQLAVGAGAAIGLVLLAGLGVSLWQMRRANRERDDKAEALVAAHLAQQQAERERDDKEKERRRAEMNFLRSQEAVDKMLTHVGHVRLRYVPQMEHLRRDLLQEALRFNEKFLQEGGDDINVRREAALAHERMGHIHQMLGERDKAEQAYRRAIDALGQLARDSDRKPEHLRSLSKAQSALANLLDDLGRHPEAEKVYLEVQALSEDLVARFPAEPDYRHGLSQAYYNLAMLRARTASTAQAEQDYRQAIAIQEKLTAEAPGDGDRRRSLALSLDALGSLLDDSARARDAEKLFIRARDLFQKLTQEYPAISDIQWDLGRTEYNLGVLYQRLVQYAEAEGAYRRSITLKEKLVEDYPSTPDYRRSCGTGHQTLAILLQNTSRPEEAEKHYTRAITLGKKLVADFPRTPEYRFQLAQTHNNRSMLLLPLGRLDEAEQSLGAALTELEKLAGASPKSPDYQSTLGAAMHNLARVLMARKQWGKARSQLEQAVIHQRAALALNPRHQMYREFLRNHCTALFSVCMQLGDPTEAEKASREAIRVMTELLRDYPGLAAYQSDLGAAMHNLAAQVLLKRGAVVEGRHLLEQAVVHQRAALKTNVEHPTYRVFLRNHLWALCETLQRQHNWEAAAEAAGQLPLLYPKGWEEHKRAAGLVARAIRLVEADGSLPPERRQALVRSHSEQAMALLRIAVQNGFKDADALRKDADLEPIRSSEAFQKLLGELK